jgi:hypothetical protein
LNIEEKAIALQAKFATKEDLENRLLNLHTSKSDHVAELRVLSKNIAAIVKKEKDQEAKLQIAQKADEIVSEICSEMIRLLDDKKQGAEKQMKFDAPTFSFSSNLPNNLTKLTAEMTEKENRRERCLEKSNELKEAREKIKSTREKNEAIFRNANDAHIKNEQTIKIYTDLDEKKKSLEEQIGKLNKTKESLQAQISPMEDQLCEAKANCAGLTTTWKADEVKLRKAHSEILKDVHEYHRLRDMARTFDSRKTTQKRQAAEADAEKAKESIATYSAKLQEIEGKLLQIQHVQAEKELIVSKLEANLTIIALRRDKDECEEGIDCI